MSPFKFRTVLRLEKLSKTTNEAPVCLRITKNRKSTYKTLLHVSPSCWDAKGQRVIRHPNADLFNAVISRKRAEIEREACLLTLSGNDVSIGAIRNKINDHMAMDFLEYAYRHCRSLMAEKYGTYLRLRSVLNKLRGFVGAGGLPVRGITEDFIRRYEHYLSSEVGSSRNTIAMSMKFISKILGDLYRQYELDETANPFRKIKFHFEPSSRQYLLAEEVAAIRDLPLKTGGALDQAREIFIFECYSGLRISDILTLRWENISADGISVRMRKTGKVISVPLQRTVQEILARRARLRDGSGNVSRCKGPALEVCGSGEVDTSGGDCRVGEVGRSGGACGSDGAGGSGVGSGLAGGFVFSYLKFDSANPGSKELTKAIGAATASINRSLKTIAAMAGLSKPISTHIGRHSFATMLLTSGIDLPVIQELMGHHDVKVTQIYAKVISRRKAEAIAALDRL